jgi:serine/threonine protein phosphatase 1
MHKRWVIPDIHGCSNTLKALMEEQIIPSRHDELYFLGDYIDRGPGSKEVIDYIRKMQNDEYNITVLKGNHEDFVLELYEIEMKSDLLKKMFGFKKRRNWFAIGGREFLRSFKINNLREIPPEYIEWMKNLQYYVKLDDFVLVHAGLNFAHTDPFKDKHSMIWARDYPIKPWKIQNRRIIHGHVPVSLEVITNSITNKSIPYIDLDNGSYANDKSGFGNLVALELNEMRMVIQDCRDEIAPQKF